MSYLFLIPDDIGISNRPRFREGMMSGLGFTAFVKLYDSMPFAACELKGNPIKAYRSRKSDSMHTWPYLNLQTDKALIKQFEDALEEVYSTRENLLTLSDYDFSTIVAKCSDNVADYVSTAIRDKGMYWLQRDTWLISKLLERQKGWTFSDLYDSIPCMQPISITECEKYVNYLTESLHYNLEQSRGVAYEYAVYRRFFLVPPSSSMKGFKELYEKFDSKGGEQ